MTRTLRVVVPSLSGSERVAAPLAALRRELDGTGAELVWVHQGEAVAPRLERPGERRIDLDRPVGFARAIHAGLGAADRGAELIALVNDDLEVLPGWLRALLRALEEDPALAAVQGVHLQEGDPERVDGWGVGWNRWYQAVQLGRGEPPPPRDGRPFPIFGVSATGAIYRREALRAVALAGAPIFDERLGSWYEDVELAVRLRARGLASACVPAARAVHAGSATGRRRPFDLSRHLVANRWLVVARMLGRQLPLVAPRMLLRDLIDLARSLAAGELARGAGYPAGWATAALRIGAFARFGPARPAAGELFGDRLGSAA